ncbi:MAG: hypothetical protein CL824_03870 [Crocinitomicaceae bacterium]|nr:hypothetical protein [Crocinitomicaceae bacterium]
MNLIIKNISALLLSLILIPVLGQGNSQKLKKEQLKLEKRISGTKMLLSKSKLNTNSSLEDLQLIDNQIKNRERLLRNYDEQVRFSKQQIADKTLEINRLKAEQIELKNQYQKMLIYAYKNRNKYGKLMYIFSANSYNEAIKRNNYLKQVQELRTKQFQLLKKNKEIINAEIIKINQEKKEKEKILESKLAEKKLIEKDRNIKNEIYRKFKKEENILKAKLQKDELKKAELKKKINEAIRLEILAEQRRRKKEEEARRKRLEKEKNKNKPTNTTPQTAYFKETKESKALGKSFSTSKGKLPWPVSKGSITEKFGKNPHPTLHNVYTNNNGLDISAPMNAQIRAIFKGEVTSVLNIPGAGKVVIIKHGSYRTVYSNLKDTYVKSGDKVSTKQTIGSLLNKSGSNISVAHLEIHVVVGSGVKCLNPSIWISK